MTALDHHHDPDADQLALTVDLASGRVTLTGDLDRESAHHLLDAVSALVPTPHHRWDIDAAGVGFCDAGGLRALAEAADFADRLGRALTVGRASRCVRRLLGIAGLDHLLAAPDPSAAAARRNAPERATERAWTGPVPALT